MYPPENSQPFHARISDRIEHKLMPGFVMEVLDVKPCETDGARPEQHMQYKITDPEGGTDWLCAYDVRKATRS